MLPYPYTFISSLYSGKPTEEGGKYYIQSTEAIFHYLIETLSTNSSLADRNISFDRLYTSIPLAKWLLEKRITCIGTMQLNRKGIHDELKETKNRELSICLCQYRHTLSKHLKVKKVQSRFLPLLRF